MTNRERLTELIKQAEKEFSDTGKPILDIEEFVTGYLLANGVIVSPCKVGDTVYKLKENGTIAKGIVESIHQNRVGNKQGRWVVTAWFDNYYAETREAGFECGTHLYLLFDDFGKTVFLTREKAEKALAEREGES